MLQLFGLVSWIVIGLLLGFSASRLLPGEPRIRGIVTSLAGLAGALLGGLLATGLDFGGLAAFDLRGFATATLGAVLALLVLRYVTLAS